MPYRLRKDGVYVRVTSYKQRADACPKHDGSGLLPCSKDCKGCAWETAQIQTLGPPPPVIFHDDRVGNKSGERLSDRIARTKSWSPDSA